MATTHDRIKALSRRVYVDAIPLGEFIEALAAFAEAERAAPTELLAAMERAADTFEDFIRMFTMANRPSLAEVASIAEHDLRAIRNAHARTGATR